MKNEACKNRILSQAGFTIIELLVTFSLMAVITGVGFASLVAYSRSQALSQAAAEVKQAVEQTRSNALSNVRPVSCSNVNAIESYTLIFCSNSYNPDGVCSEKGIENNHGYLISAVCGNQIETVSFKKIPAISISSTCSELTFDATTAAFTGITTSSPSFPCTVTISGYSNSKAVEVTSQGYARDKILP